MLLTISPPKARQPGFVDAVLSAIVQLATVEPLNANDSISLVDLYL